MWMKLKLILWKNWLITKRNYLFTTVEILIPILLFTLIAYGRSKISGLNKIEKNATYTELSNLEEIDASLPIGDFKLWYAPISEFSDNIMGKVQEKFEIPGEDIKEFESEEKLREHFIKDSSSTIAAVIFREDDEKKLNYDIGFHDRHLIWHTDKGFMPVLSSEEDKSDYSSYNLYKGFAALQIAINTAFMEMFLEKDQLNFDFSIQEFPYPPHTVDSGISQLFIYFLPLVTILSFVFLFPALLKRVGEEKQSGAKEYLKIAGMNSSMIWFGWFIHALTPNMISILAIVILMKVPFWGVPYSPIEFSSGVMVFLFLFLYCVAAITFCFLVATIIHNPSIATMTGILIWIFSYFVPQVVIVSNENLHWSSKILFAIFPNMALYYGYSAIATYELREVGIQWYNIFESGSGGANDITMGSVFLCFLFEIVIFMLLTLYIENVRPGEYGIKKHPFFPFLDFKDWVKKFHVVREEETSASSDDSQGENNNTYCIQIKKLRKQFDKKVVVDNLDMDIHKNRITVLMGNNGSGKTTTMSLLTGMLSPTEGAILVNGQDIEKHTSKVRNDMGVCTQHNLLFPDLTAIEHLKFIGMIKGKRSECTDDAKAFLKKFKIRKNAMPHELSGGMKRKLCLAMALMCDAKPCDNSKSTVLILDEPTTGLDPESRHEVFNVLLEIRKTRTIIISTHFMDEADALGDYIAIMSNGMLPHYDTPSKLKEKFEIGYHLSLKLNSNGSRKAINSMMTEGIPGVRLLPENGDNVVYLLPLNERHLYSKPFHQLEENKDEWGNIGLGITFEDVFLKAHNAKTIDIADNPIIHEAILKRPARCQSQIIRFGNIWLSLWLQRYYFLKRKFYWYIPTMIVTIIIFLTTMWLATTDTYYNYGGPKLNLSLDVYGKTGVVYGGNAEPSSLLVSKMKRYYQTALLKEEGEPFQVEDVTQEIIHKGIENRAYYKKHMVVAAEFNTSSSDKKIMVNAMYSSSALHSLPISINLAMNAILKSYLNDSFSISIANAPLNPLYTDYSPSEMSEINVGILWLILIPTGLLFLVGDYIIFPNSELSTKFIQIQNTAGVRNYVYWLTNIVFDSILYWCKLILLFLSIISLDALAFDSRLFGTREIRALIIIFVTYGAMSLPFIYLFCYRETISAGYTRLILVGLFLGIAPTVAIRAMELSEDDYYMNTANFLKDVLLCICPQFGLHYIPVKFAQKYVQNFNWVYMNSYKKKYICEVQPNPCCRDDDIWECSVYQSYFNNEESGIRNDLLKLCVSFVVYFPILCAFKFDNILHRIKYLIYRSSDGIIGRNRHNETRNGTELQRMNSTAKNEDGGNETNRLELKLKRKKCFGLLGVNGAGKTTKFRMLNKVTFFDDEEICLSGNFDGETGLSYSEQIAYCPQEDYLNFFLTGHELLSTVARMIGFTHEESNTISKALLKQFDLMEDDNTPCLKYSGGNKRKLSICLAFLGSRNVIMLDEPTSGIDPISRKKFWKFLSAYKKRADTAFLLCTRDTRDCEELCDEIGIMKKYSIPKRRTGTLFKLKNIFGMATGIGNGFITKLPTFKLSELKNKYGMEKGYIVEFQLKQDDIEDKEKTEWKTEIVKKCTNTNCISRKAYLYSLKYHIHGEVELSKLFKAMEFLKEKYGKYINDYIISQISLEDVFLSATRKTEENSNQGHEDSNV